MPNFVVLGCLEVGEKFTVGGVDGVGGWVGEAASRNSTLFLCRIKLDCRVDCVKCRADRRSLPS